MHCSTKTYQRILSPVAQQVSRLLLFEDVGIDTEIPNLKVRIDAVKSAVENLVKVGRETIEASNDTIFQRDMPASLKSVEDASLYLQQAVCLLEVDSSSSDAKKKLIEGSRGILQGTSSVLITFDSSEVRKIIGHCHRVHEVLHTAKRAVSLTDLADFVKHLIPCMSDMIQEVNSRQEDLVNQSHATLLLKDIEEIKHLTPRLISSLKLYSNAYQYNLPSSAEIQTNRDYLLSKMFNKVNDIICNLKLTESGSDLLFEDDQITTKAMFDDRIQCAKRWLCDKDNLRDSTALNEVLDIAKYLANSNTESPVSKTVFTLSNEISDILSNIMEFRCKQKGASPEASRAIVQCNEKLCHLAELCSDLLTHDECQNPFYRLALTLGGKRLQANRWLSDPRGPFRQVGLEACRSLVQAANNIVKPDYMIPIGANGQANGIGDRDVLDSCSEACEHIERAADRLYALSTQPVSNESQTAMHDLALALRRSLNHLWQSLEYVLTSQVTESCTDLVGPLRQLVEASTPNDGSLPNQVNYETKTAPFLLQCEKLSNIAKLAADITVSDVSNEKPLRSFAAEFTELGEQVVLVGRAVVLSSNPNLNDHPGAASLQQAVKDHFLMMQKNWSDSADEMRRLIDEKIDVNVFNVAQERAMLHDTKEVEHCILQNNTTGVVNGTTSIARRANRVLQIASREVENSEDPVYVSRLNDAMHSLRSTIGPMVNSAKSLIINMNNPQVREQWRMSNQILLSGVGVVKQAIEPFTTQQNNLVLGSPRPIPTTPSLSSHTSKHEINVDDMNKLTLQGQTVPNYPHTVNYRPINHQCRLVNNQYPLHCSPVLYVNSHFHSDTSGRSTSTDTVESDVEDEFNFPPPEEDQPILAAAHALHQEARYWSSRDNNLIATTKQMAALMARLSQIVRGEYGTKKDLITVSMAIAATSSAVHECANLLGNECTDKRIRSNLLNLSDRVLTIGNQLKIVSTVKATMLGTQNSAEDEENTEALVGNARNLMQTVIDTLHMSEAASIKMRVDSGHKFLWRPKRY